MGQSQNDPTRPSAAQNPKPKTRTKSLRIEVGARRVWKDNTEIRLTRLEYNMLIYLARQTGQIVTYQELWRAVWKSELAMLEGERSAVRQMMKRLRRKLGENWRKPHFIHCDRGTGFRLGMNNIEIVE